MYHTCLAGNIVVGSVIHWYSNNACAFYMRMHWLLFFCCAIYSAVRPYTRGSPTTCDFRVTFDCNLIAWRNGKTFPCIRLSPCTIFSRDKPHTRARVTSFALRAPSTQTTNTIGAYNAWMQAHFSFLTSQFTFHSIYFILFFFPAVAAVILLFVCFHLFVLILFAVCRRGHTVVV